MRILHTSDWHLGKSLYDFSLLDDQTFFIDHLLGVLAEERIDAVIIAGDIYDRPVPPAGAVQLYDHFLSQAVVQMGTPVLAIAGNHDSASRVEFGSTLTQGSGYFISGTVQKRLRRVTLADRLGEVCFTLLPYLHPADVRALYPEDAVKTFDDAYHVLLAHNLLEMDASARNVIVAHGFFAGLDAPVQSDSEINIGGIDLVSGKHLSVFDYAALGHLHAPQKAGVPHIRYSGTPLKYSLSEEAQTKSCTIVELREKGSVEISTLPVPALRDVRTVRGDFADLLEPSFHQNAQFHDYVFAEITGGATTYPMEKLRALFPHLLGLRFLAQADQAMPQRVGAGAPKLTVEELFCRFYRETKGYDIPADRLEFVRQALKEENAG